MVARLGGAALAARHRCRRGGLAVNAVIFDCDGVIVDSEPLSDEAWRKALRSHGYEPSDDEMATTVGLTDRAVYAKFAAVADLPPEDELIEEVMVECRRLYSTALEPFDDAVDAIRALAGNGVPLAVASSSSRRNLDIKLDRFDLGRYFDFTVAGDEVPAGKPSPDLYLEAARGLGVDASVCLAVEDSQAGAEAATAAGMRVVTVDRGHGSSRVRGFPVVSAVDASMLLTFLGRE
jgi:HAD superfamily hydrolase (TIGR01509 family)